MNIDMQTTEAHKLYPSSTSYLQDNHLNLFEFVGRILAKAIYEVDIYNLKIRNFNFNTLKMCYS